MLLFNLFVISMLPKGLLNEISLIQLVHLNDLIKNANTVGCKMNFESNVYIAVPFVIESKQFVTCRPLLYFVLLILRKQYFFFLVNIYDNTSTTACEDVCIKYVYKLLNTARHGRK